MMARNRLLLFVAIQILLCAAVLAIWPKLPLDDSYIFLTYARSLATTGLFAFNPGEVSYGFSSPAYVMLLAAAAKMSGMAVSVGLSHGVGLLMCALASAGVWSIWGEIEERPSTTEMLVASLIVSGPWFFSIWFICGMETGFAVLAVLGFLLWLLKLRAGAARLPWLLVGAVSAALLATTRLESGLYIAFGLGIAFLTLKSKGRLLDLVTVAAVAGGAELAWLLYAHRTFGTYMPWTSTARIIFYLPGVFGITGAEYQHLGAAGRSVYAVKAILRMAFGGPLKLQLIALPLGAAAFFLWLRRGTKLDGAALGAAGREAGQKWILQVALFGMLLEMCVFSYLFPLVQNRHLAPYLTGIWVLVSLPLARWASRMNRVVYVGVVAVFALLWIGGAMQYRALGSVLAPLFQLAESGLLKPTDRVAAEPIGIMSFEAPSYVIDIGGLTERDVWPQLMTTKYYLGPRLVQWDLQKGATELLMSCLDVDTYDPSRKFGPYCLVNARDAGTIHAFPNPSPGQ